MFSFLDDVDWPRVRQLGLRGLRYGGIGAAGLGALTLMLALSAFVALQFGGVRSALGDWLIASLGEGDGLTIEIDRYRGVWPVSFGADTITIRDGGELLAEISNADLSWKPFALLSGRVHVTSLEASDITVHSFGAGDDAPSEPSPLIPQLPVSVQVDSLSLPQITLMPGVAGGAPVTLAVEGRGGLSGSGATLALTVARTDGGRFDLDTSLTYAPDTQTLAFDVSLEDGSAAAPGLIAALTGNTDLTRVSLKATGDGPVDNWQGRVRAQAGRLGDVDMIATGDRRDGRPMRVALDLRPGPAVAGAPAAVTANATLVRDNDRYAFDDLRVDAGDARFDGQLTVTDPLGAPGVDASGILAGLAALLDADTHETLAADAVNVVLDISADDTLTQFEIARLSVSTPATDAAPVQQVTFAGAVDTYARTLRGQAAVALDEVAPFAALAGIEMAGALRGDLAIDQATFEGAAEGTLDVVYTPTSLPDPRLLGLVGEQLSIAARVSATNDGQTRIETLTLTPASGSFGGAASGLVSASSADLNIVLNTDDLAPFSDLAGVPLTGAGTFTAALTGPFEALQTNIEATVEGAQVSGTPLSGTATATLALAPAISGPVAFTGTVAGAPATAALQLNTDAGVIRLSDISASLLGVDVRGNVTLPARDMPLDAQLEGTVTDLAILGRVLGTPLQGTGTFTATSAQDADGPLTADGTMTADRPMTIEAALREVLVSGVSIAALNLDGTLAQTGEVAARLRARVMSVAHIDIEQLRLDVSGPVSRLDVSAALSGISTLEDARGTGELAVAAVYSATTVRVSSLNGRIGNVPLDLAAPFNVALDGGVEVAPLQLAVGEGEVNASFSRSATALAATAEMRDVPLRLIALLAGDSSAVRGTLDGSAELSASGSTGSGRATFRLSPRVPGDDADIPDVTLDATWDGRIAAGTVTSDAPGTDDLVVRAQLPLRARNGIPGVPSDARLEALMKGTLDVGAFWPLVPVDGHRLRGALVLDASASGLLDDLELSGTANMRDGLYENYDTGLLLSPLNISLDATSLSGRVEVSGRDGSSGTMSGRGVLDLRDSAQQRLDVSLALSSFAIARRDEVTARASGDVTVTWPRGEDDAPTPVVVGGHITVERLEAVIPDRLASDVETINVTRVDAEGVPLTGEAEAASRPASADAPSAIELALTIDVPNQVFVRGRGLESEWAGNLAVTGSTDTPNVRGAFEVVRGTFDFLGQTFDLTGGRIEFTGGREIDPLLNVKAVYEDDGFQAVVAVTGPASDPDIAISSVPALPEEEVLSRILFGTGTGQLSAFQAVQLAQTAATLTGLSGGGGGVLDAMRRTLGVDVLSVGEGGLEVGSYVSDGVYLGVAQGLEANSGQVTVEVELTDDISVESDVGAAGDTSVGVTWERDY